MGWDKTWSTFFSKIIKKILKKEKRKEKKRKERMWTSKCHGSFQIQVQISSLWKKKSFQSMTGLNYKWGIDLYV